MSRRSAVVAAPVTAVLAVAAVVLSLLAPITAQAAPDPRGKWREPAPTAMRSDAAPHQVRTAGVDRVSAGGEFSCGIKGAPAGTLWCWGRNSFGQLGSGAQGAGSVAPAQVGGSAGWTQVSAGGATACGISKDGSLRCWGLNHRGQVGNGGSGAVLRPERIAGKQRWAQVATGWFHTCAVRTNGRLSCWGDNSHGQLGTGGTQGHRTPHRVAGKDWASVSTGGWSTCATKTDGTLWCWGRNVFGQLGTGDFAGHTTPTRVRGGKARWSSVSLSWSHTCAVTRNGLARCWGRNDRGQAGPSADIYVTRPTPVAGDHRASEVSTAEGSSCLVDTGRKLWCWGDNRFAQISAGQALDAPQTPPRRRGGAFTAVSGGWFHFCGVNARGASVCWGDNQQGQLGSSQAAAPQSPTYDPVQPGTQRELTLRLATLNVLSNSHTRPGGGFDRFGPSRIRADWTAQALTNNEIDVVGLQEPDAGQVAAILDGSNGRLAAYPDPVVGGILPETTIVWDTTKFDLVETDSVRSQFIARKIRRPVVKLRQVASGREFWVVNIHNAPNAYQTKRNKAVKAQLKKVVQLEATGLPVFYVGDFNEKETIFCKVLKGTGLVAANGGRLKPNGTCVPPRAMRIDWLFGSAGTRWRGYSVGFPPLVRMSTDHPMVMADVTVS